MLCATELAGVRRWTDDGQLVGFGEASTGKDGSVAVAPDDADGDAFAGLEGDNVVETGLREGGGALIVGVASVSM